MNCAQFFDRLWQGYSAITPQAARIHQLFLDADGEVVNDHVAFRTFHYPPFDIDSLEPRLFDLGYRRDQTYQFPAKKLRAWSYVTDQPDQPLIFLSELVIAALPDAQFGYLKKVLQHADPPPEGPEAFFCGRLWPMPSWKEYQSLEAVSDYAAWLLAWGFCANHFTVSVNRLHQHHSLEDVVSFLQQHGFKLNSAGGMIKGSPELMLEQASTLADEVTLEFGDGSKHPIPSCYYEFARRYLTDHNQLYRGFVTSSADKIFESTDRQRS